VFFASKGSLDIAIPSEILAEEVDRTRASFAWQNMDKWEEKFDDELDKYEVITDRDNTLISWIKKMTFDAQQDMFYKIPKRIWNLSQDYIKLTRDNPSLDDDDEDEDEFLMPKQGKGDKPEDLLHILQKEGKIPKQSPKASKAKPKMKK